MSEDISRGLIKYTSRDYDSLMKEFYALVPTLTELWRPEADADPGVVLWKFLASAADMLGVNYADTIAIGDSDNDNSIVQASGLGLAVSNATNSLKAVADEIISSNDEHAIDYVLARYFS